MILAVIESLTMSIATTMVMVSLMAAMRSRLMRPSQSTPMVMASVTMPILTMMVMV